MSNGYYRYRGAGFGIPEGIKYLLIWNAIIFVLQQILHNGFGPIAQLPVELRSGAQMVTRIYPVDSLETLFGTVPALFWQHGFVWQIATYMFLHGGFFHILFNMFILWMFGSDLERVWGTRRFISFYFFCGIGAGLVNVLVTPHAFIPTIGASGAIYGVLLGYALYFPERQVFLYFLIPVPVRVFVIVLGVIELVSSLSASGGNISHVTHLGGLAFAWIYLRGLGRGGFLNRLRGRRRGPRVIDFTRDRDPWGS